MQVQQSSLQLYSPPDEAKNHLYPIESIKKNSTNVSRYLESSSMLYSPHKKIPENFIKNQIYNSKQESPFPNPGLENQRVYEKDQTKSAHNFQPSQNKLEQNSLGKVVARFQARLEGAQVKIASLTNIVKLLQKYSQTKDDQYQKQKENQIFNNVGKRVYQIQSTQIENKIKEFNLISKQMKRQIEKVLQLKHKLEQNLRISNEYNALYNQSNSSMQVKKFPQSKSIKSKKSQDKSQTSQGSLIDFQQLTKAFEDMQQRLRDQMNKKIEICLGQIKKVAVSVGNSEVNGIDQNFFEDQINSLNFTINKVENQCTRNKMLLENQIENLFNRIPIITNAEYFSAQNINPINQKKIVREKSVQQVSNRSHSRKKTDQKSFSKQNREKQKSSRRHYQNQPQKLLDKRRAKQEQLQQAIRRKKQIKDKLRNNHSIKNF